MRKHLTLLLILMTAGPTISAALSPSFPTSPPVATARYVESAPKIDGDILNEEIWASIPAIEEMWQTQPNLGESSSEKTSIRIAYSNTYLYLGVICYDSAPERLVVSDARRDADLTNTDAFMFILDTYHDLQNGFVFGTNPIGIEYDAQVDNEGQGNFNANRQQGGTIGGFNINWDASWEVKTRVTDYGWVAEFAIPFRTLRYKTGDNVTWGFNFRRNIRKTNEINYWAPIPVGFTLNRLSLAGDLTNLNLKSPGNLKFIPYILNQNSKVSTDNNIDSKIEVGADLKYSISPSVTLDLTYNTDFAQVEVDEEQVNLDRFNLFFPEKRPFFLENAGLFGVGSPGEVDLFFSRRIGIGAGGQPVPIIGGTRLSGRINKTSVGFLSMFTEGISESEVPQNNFSVARVNHEFGGRSALGAAFIGRFGMDQVEGDRNQTFAIDGKWGLGKKARLSGYFAKSNTPGIVDKDHSLKMQADYQWNNWEISSAYTEVGEGFNPEVGFLLREAFRKPEFRILYHLRPRNKMAGLLELRPHVSYRSYWDFNGFLETSFLHIDNHWEWVSGLEIHTGINYTVEGVKQDFEISEGVVVPQGTYRHNEAQIVFRTNLSKPFYLSTRHVLGGFFGGERYANSGTMGFRVGDKFNSELTIVLNDIRLPQGDFDSNVFRARLSYSFTPRIYAQSLMQYNSASEIWSANIRFGWLQQANTGLFLVYNYVDRTDFFNQASLTIKYSRMFDVIQ